MRDDFKILYVTAALLSGPHIGCMQRAVNIARQLRRCGAVTMLAVSHRFDESSVDMCRGEFGAFHQVALKPYTAYPSPWGEIRRKWDMHWPFSYGIAADADGQRLFARLAGTHDLVWFHTLGSAFPFSIQTVSCPKVMDFDDVNHCIYAQSAKYRAGLRSRLSAKVQSFKWELQERRALKNYQATVVCSEQDKQLVGGAGRVYVIPNGYPKPAVKPQWEQPNPHRIGFIGALGYYANYDGLVWFRDHVWRLIKTKKPSMTLRIVGDLPPEKNRIRADGFEFLGYIKDPIREIKTWSALIVPVLYGGGTRIKILDAFSKLCPVVSTGIGAYGIAAGHTVHLLIGNTPDQFADGCVRLSEHPEIGRSLAQEAWNLFIEKYTWETIGTDIPTIVSEVIKSAWHR